MRTTVTKLTMVLALGTLLVGCATPRTKDTDPSMRVMVDPDSIEKGHYVRLVNALQQSGKYIVVDRADAFKAAKKEQDFQYTDGDQRVDTRERYATYGKMYGVGGVVVGKAQCSPSTRFMSYQGDYDCVQNLSIVDARSGEIIATAEFTTEGEGQFLYGEMKVAPAWDEAVQQLNDNFPKKYVKRSRHEKIVEREDEAEQVTQQMRAPAQEQ